MGRHEYAAWIKETDPSDSGNTDTIEHLIPFSPVVLQKNGVEDDPPDDAYPFTAILGSTRFHLGSGTRTAYSERISEFGLKGEIEISSEDGKKLEITSGDTVKIVSRHGEIQREIKLNNELKTGKIFIPLAINGNDAMNLVELTQIGGPDSSGWKTCKVTIEKKEE